MPFFLIAIFFQSLVFFCSGHIKCSEEKVLICGVIKNGEKGFGNVKKCAEELGNLFADYRVIVYENNSTDATKNLYHGWTQNNQKVIFISEDLTQDFLDNYTVKIGDYRTQFIARARNIVLEKALSCEFDDYAYHIMVDLDGIGPWPVSEIINTIENPEHEWDAICANGSYDLYAIRSDKYCLNLDLIGQVWLENQAYIGNKLQELLQNGLWYPVESAFGGLAIYKRSSIKGCLYQGYIKSDYIKYLLKKSYKSDLIYKNLCKKNMLKLRYTLRNLKEWHRLGSIEYTKLDHYHICEHVQFHNDMISNGHNKIFINPNLKVLSLEHRNY